MVKRGTVIHAEISFVKYRNVSCVVFVSMPPTVLNENLISRYKSLVASLYDESPKEVEVGSLERNRFSS